MAARSRSPLRLLSRTFSKILFLICLAASMGYCANYLLVPWLDSERLSRNDHRLGIVPSTLPNNIGAPLANPSIEIYGFRFQIPKKEIPLVLKDDQKTVIQFRDGSLIIRDMTSDKGSLLSNSEIERTNAEKLLGNKTVQSDYALMEEALSATPGQVKWWKFRTAENKRAELLISLKHNILAEEFSSTASANSSVYKFAIGEFQGFQFGSPDFAPNQIHVEIFNLSDQLLRLDLYGGEAHEPLFTQQEINALVGSIRRVQPPVSLHVKNIDRR
jgi:hypothetical protein